MIQLFSFLLLFFGTYSNTGAQSNPSGSTSPQSNNLDPEDSRVLDKQQRQQEIEIDKIRSKEFKRPEESSSAPLPNNEIMPNNAPALTP